MTLRSKGATTIIVFTFIWLFSVMDSHVCLQISSLSKALATISPVTHKGLDSRMGPTVYLQATGPGVLLSADFALVWLLTGVN